MTTTTAIREPRLLERLSRDDLRAVRRLGDVITVAPGTILQPLGGCSRWFHCVLEGTVGASDGGPVDVAGPGTCFPAEALHGDLAPAARSTVAITTVTLLVMGLREFHGALDTIPGFAAAVGGRS